MIISIFKSLFLLNSGSFFKENRKPDIFPGYFALFFPSNTTTLRWKPLRNLPSFMTQPQELPDNLCARLGSVVLGASHTHSNGCAMFVSQAGGERAGLSSPLTCMELRDAEDTSLLGVTKDGPEPSQELPPDSWSTVASLPLNSVTPTHWTLHTPYSCSATPNPSTEPANCCKHSFPSFKGSGSLSCLERNGEWTFTVFPLPSGLIKNCAAN